MSEEQPAEDVAEEQEEETVVEEEQTEADAAVAAAVAVSYAASLDPSQTGGVMGITNKWSKNGFGAPVSKQTGKFSKEESVLVRNAIEEYCNSKQISISRLCSECDHKAELKGAWMEIAKRLPHRSVQSVYRHGIRQCHPFRRGAWSEEEVATLQDLVTRMGKKWSAIQSKLNRSADSCRDKYREMSDDYIKGRWKEEETETLKRLIREYLIQQTSGATTHITDMKDLGKFVEEEDIQIPWSTISKRMGKRSRLSCFKKWQKMTGLFGPTEGDTKRPAEEGKSAGEPETKRVKAESESATAGAAKTEDDEDNSAKMAAETVEALELPDTAALATAATTEI